MSDLKPTKDLLSYISSHGNVVDIELTEHAKKRFCQRWAHAFPTCVLSEPTKTLAEWFSRAKRIQPKSNTYKKRLKRHGKDTLYFSAPPFTFVVQDARIRTVELASKNMRHLNKIKPPDQIKFPDQNKPFTHPPFKVTAHLISKEGKSLFKDLGSYDSSVVNGQAERLRDDKTFLRECVRRLQVRNRTEELFSIIVSLGKKDKPVIIPISM
jgi:hypothetical protein